MEENEKKLFGKRLKEIRSNKNWTQDYLAERMDISSKYLSSIERGKENPTFEMLTKISASLGVEMWELFDYNHLDSPEKLKEIICKIIDELNEKQLAISVKFLRSIIR